MKLKISIFGLLTVLLISLGFTSVIYAESEYISLSTSTSEASVGELFTVTSVIQLDPDVPEVGNEWNKIVIDLPSDFVMDDPTPSGVTLVDPLNEITNITVTSSTITLDLADITTGSTINVIFSGSFTSSAVDEQAYTFTTNLSNDTTTESDSISVIAKNPTEYEVSKNIVDPTGYVLVGDQVTYQIDVTFTGTGTIDPDITIVDTMDPGATFISATDNGVNSGNVTTWNLTQDNIDSRTASYTVVYEMTENNFEISDTVSNNVDVMLDDTSVANDSASLTIEDDSLLIINNPIKKVANPSTNDDGSVASTDGEILYEFKPINFEGTATVYDFTLIDTVGDNLIVNTINFGSYTGGGSLISVTIDYDGVVPDKVLTDFSSGSYELPNYLKDKVNTITYYYGDVTAPFSAITPPSIQMTVTSEYEEGVVANSLDVDFDLKSENGEIGNGDVTCPPSFDPTIINNDQLTCDYDSDSSIYVVNDLPFVSVQSEIEEDKTYYNGNEVNITYTVSSEEDSLTEVVLTNVINDHPDGFDFVSMDSSDNFTYTLENGYINVNTPVTLNPGDSFTYTITYEVTSDSVEDVKDAVYVEFDNPYRVLAGNYGDFTTEPEDFLGTGGLDRVLTTDLDISLNPPLVNIEKTATDDLTVYAPESLGEADYLIDYQIKLQNVDFGENSASLINPEITDTIPEDTEFNTDSVVIGGYFTNDDIDSLVSDENGFTIVFNGELPVGEEVTIDYNLTVLDGILAGIKSNTATFTQVEDTYDSNSTFTSTDSSALVQPIAAQVIAKVGLPLESAPGGQINYVIDYENTGTTEISDIVFIDVLPASTDGRGTTIDNILYTDPDFETLSSQPEVSYNLFDGTNTTELPFDRTQIESIQVDFQGITIEPGENFSFSYDMTIPNSAVGGDLVVNDGTFTSNAYYEDSVFEELDNTTNKVTTTVVELEDPEKEIGDLVYLDTNKNGVYDAGIDKGLDNYQIELYDDTNTLVAQTITNNDGQYLFTNLDPGDYSVKVITDTGQYLLDTNDLAADVNTDSYYDADFRFIPATLSGEVFHDINSNGVRDLTETLYENELDISLYNDQDELIQTQTTVNQEYLFENLEAGTYKIVASDQFTDYEYFYTVQAGYEVNEDYTQSTQNALEAGSDDVYDFGLVRLAKITGTVFEDFTNDGTYISGNEISDVNITLSGDFSAVEATDENGYYEFSVYPGTYVVTSDLVENHMFSPTQNDNDVDTNGMTTPIVIVEEQLEVRDIGQVPLVSISGNYFEDMDYDQSYTTTDLDLEGYTVNLLDDTLTLIESTQTDTNGAYSFIDLQPDTAFTVEFVKNTDELYSPITNLNVDGTVDVSAQSPGTDVVDVDGAIYVPVTISGRVVFDQDLSNTISTGDIDVANYTIEIYDSNDNLIESLQTDIDGTYISSEQVPGSYYVSVDYQNYEVSERIDDTQDDTFKFTDEVSDTFILNSRDNQENVNLGLYEYLTISGDIYVDDNFDGIRDLTESLYSNEVEVNLLDSNGNVLETQNTVNQHYEFTDLVFGQYTVVSSEQLSDYNTIYSPTTDYVVNSDYSQEVSLDTELGNDYVRDFGLNTAAKISGTVFEDNNLNSTNDDNSYLEGLEITLTGTEDKNVLTDANGYYEFYVYPGTYEVNVELLDNYSFSDTANDSNVESNGDLTNITLNIAEEQVVDAGEYEYASINGKYYEDVNYDQQFTTQDIALEGFEVILSIDNTQVATTTTDANGDYSFTNLQPLENYEVTFGKENDESYSPLTNLDTTTGIYDVGSIEAGSVTTDVDGAIYVPVTISGYVVEDKDYSKNINSGDAYFMSYAVEVYDTNDNLVSSISTDNSGFYISEELVPGSYYVVIENNNRYEVEKGSADDEFKFSDEQSDVYTLNSRDNQEFVNKGLINYIEISGNIFEDINADGKESILDNDLELDVNLYYNNELYDTTTSLNGEYEFNNLLPGQYYIEVKTDMIVTTKDTDPSIVGSDLNSDYSTDAIELLSGQTNDKDFDGGFYNYASVGDLIFIDGDQDGNFDEIERVAPFINIDLVNESGDVVKSTTTTTSDTADNYLFENIVPGKYKLVAQIPSGFYYLDTLNGFNEFGETDYFTLNSSDVLLDKDGRLALDIDNPSIIKTTIGDYIWLDENYNGLQDKSEYGIADVEVQLFSESGLYIYSTLSDQSGKYSFNVVPGEYQIKLIMPEGYSITRYVDTNEQFNSSELSDEFKTDVISVTDFKANDSVDFGLYQPSVISGYYYNDVNRNSELDNEGVEGVTISLYSKELDKIISTTITDENGYYEFNDLIPGSYEVRATYPEGEYVHNTEEILKIDLANNSIKENNNFAYYINGSISGKLYIDNNNNGTYDEGDENLEGFVVNLVDKDGNIIATTTTDKDGNYTFEDIEPGDYQVIFEIEPDDNGDYANIPGFNNGVRDVSISDGEEVVNEDGGIILMTDVDSGPEISNTGITYSIFAVAILIIIIIVIIVIKKKTK